MEPRFAHGIVINLDRSPSRMEHFNKNTAPLFERITRISAVDRNDLSDSEIQDFEEQAHGIRELHPALRIPKRVRKNYWAGSLAVWLSHQKALEMGVLLGGSFMVLEDDATPRLPLLAATPKPPEDRVAVWGGALKGGSYGSHYRAYDKWSSTGGDNLWKDIEQSPAGVRNRYQATTYELPEALAPAWLSTIKGHPIAYDDSWNFAMLAVPTVAPRIEVFHQKLALGSDRSSAVATNSRRYQYLDK